MFCPRCGRPVKENANFCGGCGLSKSEIENYIKIKSDTQINTQSTSVSQPVEQPKTDVVTVSQPVEEVKAENTTVVDEISNETVIDVQPTSVDCQNINQTDTISQNDTSFSQQNYTQENTYTQPEQNLCSDNCCLTNSKKSENLSTFDFFLMMIISAIPIIGFIYLIYLSVQNDNITKRSFARASLLILLSACVIGMMFSLGILISALV